MELIDIIVYGLKLLIISVCLYYTLVKLTYNSKCNYYNFGIAIISNLIIIIICCFAKYQYGSFYSIIIFYFGLSILFMKSCKQSMGYSMIVTLISLAICFIILVISVVVSYGVKVFLGLENRIIICIIIGLFEISFTILFFRIKRFRNGFMFLRNKMNNMYLDIIMMNISAFIILLYGMFGSNYENFVKRMFISLIVLSIIMIIMIRKTLTLSYKQKLLQNTLKDYEDKIKEKDLIIENLSQEKFKISKLNHEFYNRQKALELKVENVLNNMNYEMGEEINLKDKIDQLSKEYANKSKENKIRNELAKTDIEEIDDMFKYMQSECIKNGIEFILQINGNIHYLINNIIEKTKLVTLIGDHLRDAIIAINYSNMEYKSILAILGIKENCYEFCIYDSGIEFEIETFEKLGLEPATTHKDNGGTGIGFITTFETLKETKASLIIEEKNKLMENNYTKSIKFRFDNKHEFKIISYRASKLKENIKEKRISVQEFFT